MIRSRQIKSLWAGIIVAVAGMMMATSAQAEIRVYEPFDYAVSNQLSGASGSTEIGLAGTWQNGWVKRGYVYPANPDVWGLDTPSWNGVVNNVPTAPATVKYAGVEPGQLECRMYRQLSSDAGTMAGADNILWLAAVRHYENRTGGTGLYIGLGSGYVYDRGRNIGTGPNGRDFMGSSAADNGTGKLYASIETNGVPAVYDIFPAASVPPTTEDCVVVLKYTFGASSNTVESVVFSENDALSEAAFDSHPDKASASIDSSLIDESTFNLLSFCINQEENTIDEIRIGDTFDDVVGLAVGPVDADVSAVVPVPDAVNADGSSVSTITVTLRDAFWVPVTNHTVSLSGNTGNATITVVNSVSDANGQATFEVKSSTVETEVFTATDTTASLVITEEASVEFVTVDQNPPPTPTFVTPLGPVTYDTISVAANPVTDPEGKDVEYRFNNVTLGTDSGWLSSPSNTFDGLDSETTYSFTIEARDTALIPNVSAASGQKSATTLVRPSSGWTISDSTASVLVWLDASDTATLTTNASGQVSQWDDKSGNGNHMLQANTSYQPVSGTRTLNGLNVVDFDGSGDRMQEAANAFGSTISNTMVFVVVETDSPDGDGTQVLRLTDGDYWMLYSKGYDDDGDFRFGVSGRDLDGNNSWMHLRHYTSVVPGATAMQGRPVIFGLYDCPATNSIQLWIDAVSAAQWVHYGSGTSVGPSATSSGIELAYGGVFDGVFAEVVIIDGIISAEERQTIEGYLAWRWGSEHRLPAGHPYRDLPPAAPPVGGLLLIIR